MNWLQKLSKVIKVRHIPYQVYAALKFMTQRDWNMKERDSYRDWSAQRNAALFDCFYTTVRQYNEQEKHEIAVKVHWSFPFDSKYFDTATGLDGMEFMVYMRFLPVVLTPGRGWSWDRDGIEEGYSERFKTPNEAAAWVASVLKDGFPDNRDDHDGGSDNNDDDDDLFPQWPYPEEEVNEEEMAVIKRNPGYMG